MDFDGYTYFRFATSASIFPPGSECQRESKSFSIFILANPRRLILSSVLWFAKSWPRKGRAPRPMSSSSPSFVFRPSSKRTKRLCEYGKFFSFANLFLPSLLDGRADMKYEKVSVISPYALSKLNFRLRKKKKDEMDGEGEREQKSFWHHFVSWRHFHC